jgi:hypothetical protein
MAGLKRWRDVVFCLDLVQALVLDGRDVETIILQVLNPATAAASGGGLVDGDVRAGGLSVAGVPAASRQGHDDEQSDSDGSFHLVPSFSGNIRT